MLGRPSPARCPVVNRTIRLCDHDRADAQGRVPLGAAPDQRADRLDHPPAWSRPRHPRPHHPELPGRDLEVARPRLASGAEPIHLLVDSTGLHLCGVGEWLIDKHDTGRRRSWRKLHIGMDADTGRIFASALTTHDIDDGAQVGPLLDQVAGPVASFMGDGAYDQDGVSGSVAERHPDARIIVPPHAHAVLSEAAETAPTQRDRD